MLTSSPAVLGKNNHSTTASSNHTNDNSNSNNGNQSSSNNKKNVNNNGKTTISPAAVKGKSSLAVEKEKVGPDKVSVFHLHRHHSHSHNSSGNSSIRSSPSSQDDHDLGDLLSGEKGKRRTDRSDSSESSDSGVATLSPSTSDSPELISPYSPCDLSSDISSGFCGSGSSLGSSPSLSSSPPLLCDLGPEPFDHNRSSSQKLVNSTPSSTPSKTSDRMTAVASAKLDPGPAPTHLSAVVSNKAKVPVTNFISFQIPQPHLQNSAFADPLKLLGGDPAKQINNSNVVQSTFNCDVRKFASTNDIKSLIAALGYEPKNTGSGGGNEVGGGNTVNGIGVGGGQERVGSVPPFTNSNNNTVSSRNRVEFKSVNVPTAAIRPTPAKSYVLRGEGPRNGKVIILSVKPTALVPPMNSKGKNCTVVIPTISNTTTSTTSINYNIDNQNGIKKSIVGNKPSNTVFPSLQRKKPKQKCETGIPSSKLFNVVTSSPSTSSITKITNSLCLSTPYSKIPSSSTPTIAKPPNNLPGQPLAILNSATPNNGNTSPAVAATATHHFNGPKKTDHVVDVIKTNNKLKSNHVPTRISLRNNNINHSLVLVSTTTASSKFTLSSARSAQLGNTNNSINITTPSSAQTKFIPTPTVTIPSSLSNNNKNTASENKDQHFVSKFSNNHNNDIIPPKKCLNINSIANSNTKFSTTSSAPTVVLQSSSSSSLHLNLCNKKPLLNSRNSFKTIDSSRDQESSLARNLFAINNASNSRKRKLASSIASSSEVSSSSCSSSSSSECVPLLDDHDADDLPDNSIQIISCSSSSSTLPSSIKSSSSICSNEESSSEPKASIVKNLFNTSFSLSSSPSSPCSTNNSDHIGVNSERLLARSSASAKSTEFCMWKDCKCIPEANLNFLEHIQTAHVAPQSKPEGYVCLWKGCKVYNKKSCSLSWLEHHVLTHGGNKPFRCIFTGCGLSFGTQGALERHVNSHILSNGNAATTNGNTTVAKKLDSTPSKLRRKKNRVVRSVKNSGHVVDFFDKRTMEVIKFRLCSAAEFEDSIHTCTFKSQVLTRRTSSNEEPHLFVRWHPESILPDEWIPESQYKLAKTVPFRQIPSDKIKILFPQMFPPERKEKAQRKWKPPTTSNSSKIAGSSNSIPLQNGNSSSCSEGNSSSCSCPTTNGFDDCTSLNSDWAMLLAEKFLS